MKTLAQHMERKTWLCGGNKPQPFFWNYAKAKFGIGGFKSPSGEKIGEATMINHLLKRIEDLEAAAWCPSSICRCCACGVAVLSAAEVRWNNNQHYCPDCTVGLVWEYESDEGLNEKQIEELADAPFHSHGFFSGHSNVNPEYPASAYWAELVKTCPEIGLRYISKRQRRTL